MRTVVRLMFLVALLPGAVRLGFSRGDKIIPQVVDGPGWMTKFDLTNISPETYISNMRLSFYKNDGSKWTLQTNKGTASDFTLSIGPRQTLRVETQGSGSSVSSGYAVIYDEETTNSEFSDDFVLGISVFYVVSSGSGVVDTVTVNVPSVTAVAAVPMEMNKAGQIYSGFSIVNWAKTSNKIDVTLYPENYTTPGSPMTASFTLQPGEQRAEFLDQSLFPSLTTFKGMAEIVANGPISFVGLLQTRASDGTDRYSTLVPVDKEDLRRNSYVVVLQVSDDSQPYEPLDIDRFTVDYFRKLDGTEAYSWDLEYRYSSSNRSNRYLQPYNGAALAPIGIKDDASFDAISLPTLKAMSNYSDTATIDLSGSNLQLQYAFAIRTDLRNYAKARIVRIVDTTDGSRQNKDIVLEVCVYR